MFSLYSLVSPEVERARADGFTCLGPYYGDQAKSGVLQKAEQAGLKCIYTVGKRINFVGDPNYAMPTDDEIRRVIQTQVNQVASRHEIAVWNLANEELRYWRPDEMRWLRVAAAACHAADPLHRPVMMYDPNHRTAAALARTVRYLDFSSKGMYANSSGFTRNRVWIRWSVEQEVAACALANPQAIPVSVLWMAQDPKDPAEDERIPAWTRHDVYLSLVTGAKGILVWSGWNRRRGFQRTFKKYYRGYAAAAKELTGDLGLGQVFLFGQHQHDLHVRVLAGPPILTVQYQKQSVTYPSVSHLDIAFGDSRWLFLVNSAEREVRVGEEGLPSDSVLVEDALDDGFSPSAVQGTLEVSLPPLGVHALQFHRLIP